MTGAGSRRKGADFERLIRQWFDKRDHRDPFTLLTHGHLGESEEDMRVGVEYAYSDPDGYGQFFRFEALLVVEVKNHKSWSLGTWWRQAVEQARRRKGHAVLIVKRKGTTDPAEQWVVQSLEEWTAMVEEIAG